jgi:hypothetical protein
MEKSEDGNFPRAFSETVHERARLPQVTRQLVLRVSRRLDFAD